VKVSWTQHAAGKSSIRFNHKAIKPYLNPCGPYHLIIFMCLVIEGGEGIFNVPGVGFVWKKSTKILSNIMGSKRWKFKVRESPCYRHTRVMYLLYSFINTTKILYPVIANQPGLIAKCVAFKDKNNILQ